MHDGAFPSFSHFSCQSLSLLRYCIKGTNWGVWGGFQLRGFI